MRFSILVLCLLPVLCVAQGMTVEKFKSAISSRGNKDSLVESARSWFGKDISTGADAKTDGLNAAWALESADAKSVSVKTSDGKEIKLRRIGRSSLFATVETLPEATAFKWQFAVDGKVVGPERSLEVYSPDPYSIVDPSVPKGTLAQMPKWKSTIYEGTERDWWLYVPAQYKPEDPACLMVFQDGQWAHGYAPPVFDNLIARHEIPVTVVVFLAPGNFADGRSNRSIEYDTLSDKYVRYLLGEIIPEVQKKVNLRTDADSWAIGGISSGGICSFTAAWERPDKFSKVFSWVGSFANIAGGESGIAGGHNYPALIRRNPPKPIRVFLQDGTNDVDNQFGNWWLCNLSMESALKFKGYNYKFIGGNGFHSDRHGRSIMGESLKWLWRGVR